MPSMSVDQPAVPRPGRNPTLNSWLAATRPRSLPIAIGPVVVGAAFAWARTGALDIAVAAMILAASLLIQLVTNLQNDVGYTVRGGERSGTRVGLPRATANGWLRIGQVRTAIVVLAIVATALGFVLFARLGWPVLAIGFASLAAALAYMGGPRPIAYTPFGELTVFIFFGLVAVIGTEWALTGGFNAATILAAMGVGAVAAAALTVNNHRDLAHDQLFGRRTFSVIMGAPASSMLYAVQLLSPFALVPFVAFAAGAPTLLLPWVMLPPAVKLRRDFANCPPGLPYNAILYRTFKLGLAYSGLLAIGAILGRVLH
jgi:1,4-dihydroxy-2-naphthoate polyprenyltransferase